MKIDTTLQNKFIQASSAKRINSAADDAAGLAIAQKMTAQKNGYDIGTENALSMKDLAQTAEGALSSVNDSLQRMRELALQASNGTLTTEDRKGIQQEIDQLKKGINAAAKGTEFNTVKVLDGSFADKTIASNPNGTGRTMTIENSSLESLGIQDFDVTGSFDISTLDSAIAKVSDSRSSLGAASNGIDRTVSSNGTASENLARSESQLADADMAKTLTDLKNLQLRQQIQQYAQQKNNEQKSGILNLMG